MVRVVHYVTEGGKDYLDEWFRSQDAATRARVQTRIDRIELGNFGDHKGVAKAFLSFGSTVALDTVFTMVLIVRRL